MRRGPYKRYLTEDVPIPRTTVYRRRQEQLQLQVRDERGPEPHVYNNEVNNRSDASSDDDMEVEENDAESSGSGSNVSDLSTDNDTSESEQETEEDDDTDDRSGVSSPVNSEDSNEGSDNERGIESDASEDDASGEEQQEEAEENIIFDGGPDMHFVNDGPEDEVQQRGHTLYEGCHLTQEESHLLIMSFIIRWGLPEKSIENLLELIDCHLPNPALGSKYTFLKQFPIPEEIKTRYTCPDCHSLLDEDFQNVRCVCGKALQRKTLHKKGHYFAQLSITDQIKKVMSKDSVYFRMRRECQEKDIVSGRVYRRLRAAGTIGQDDITLQWNTDGVRPFKSAKGSVWPIQACINELPYRERRENMILCGLYYGKTKPLINSFLRPFVDELRNLHSNGFLCNIPGREEPIRVKVHTLVASVDSVARAPLQGILQFNGERGCSFCLKKTTTIERGRGTAAVYIGSRVGRPRTREQHLNAVDQLEAYNQLHRRKKKHIQGAKEATVLLLLPVFDIVSSFVPDYMHAVLEGTVEDFIKHWKDGAYSEEDWHLKKEVRDLLDQLLCLILPPCEISRASRGLDDVNLWKASEFKNFLLYYSLVCLKERLPMRQLKHWFLLVYSMTIFLKENFSHDEFYKAKQALEMFVRDIPVVYPNCNHLFTFNVHLLLHIPAAVENYGALWASSNFPFEHFNGVIARMITGTNCVPNQICRSFLRLRQVNHVGVKLFAHPDCSEQGKTLYTKLMSRFQVSKFSQQYGGNVRLFGAPRLHKLSVVEKVLSQQLLLGFEVKDTAMSFRRLIFLGVTLHAASFETLRVRNNSTVKLTDGRFLIVQHILLVEKIADGQKKCFIFGEQLDVTGEQLCQVRELNLNSGDIFPVCHRSRRTIATHPENIVKKCVLVPYGNNVVPVCLVNTIERD